MEWAKKKLSVQVCDSLYKKELFNEIRFPLGKLYEDFKRDQSRTHVSVDFNTTNL